MVQWKGPPQLPAHVKGREAGEGLGTAREAAGGGGAETGRGGRAAVRERRWSPPAPERCSGYASAGAPCDGKGPEGTAGAP